jgi:O-antigen/teichoic acid export membrane protein
MIFLYFFQRILRSKTIPSIHVGYLKTLTAASQGLGILFSSGLDVIVVAGTLGLGVAGSYGISTRLLGTIMIPAAALAPSQFRHFAKLRSAHAPLHKLKRELRALLVRNSALTVAIALCVLAIYGYVFRLMTHGVYPTNYALGGSLAIATILSAIFATFFAAAAGDLGLRIGRNLSIAVGLLNLITTFFLTKAIGILGPAMASIACYALGSALWLGYVKRSPAFLTVI